MKTCKHSSNLISRNMKSEIVKCVDCDKELGKVSDMEWMEFSPEVIIMTAIRRGLK